MTGKEYNIFLRVSRWFHRIRQRKGYGVHSPFAFQFITDVIYNSEPYYAYEDLRRNLKASLLCLDEYDPESGLAAKDIQLLFRLANFQEADGIRILPENYCPAIFQACFKAARPKAGFNVQQPDFCYCDAAEALPQPADLPLDAMIVVRGLHRNAESEANWQTLKAAKEITLTFDLGRFGIALRRPKLQKQDYIVNFF